jgi:hypothetical protein
MVENEFIAKLTTSKLYFSCIFPIFSCNLKFVWNLDVWVLLICFGWLVHVGINNHLFEF